MIEIFLAILCCMFLLAGIANIVMKFQEEPSLHASLNQWQLHSSFSPYFLNRAMHLAETITSSDQNLSQKYETPPNIFPVGAQMIKGTNNDVNGSDTITMRYHGNALGNVFDCNGAPMRYNQSTESYFYINTSKALVCCPVINGLVDMANPQVLIEDVEAMHIRYGVESKIDSNATHYISANNPHFSVDKVKNVKLSILIKTSEKTSPLLDTKYYNLEDEELGPYKDNFLRRVFTTTISVSKSQ